MKDYTKFDPKWSAHWPERSTRKIWCPDGKRKTPRHMFLPDWQACKGVPGQHLVAIGRYCAYKKPDVIILAGDQGDFPSCSAWDKRKWVFGQRSYGQDIAALEHALQLFLGPIVQETEATGWVPRILITLGNHENRVDRALESLDEGKWRDAIEWPTQVYERYGIEVFPYLEPVMVDGIAYSHYFDNPMTGRPLGGMIGTMLKNVGFSFSMGHKQVLETGTRTLANGQVHRGCIAGACYLHDEGYRSKGANLHWRGIIQKNELDGFGDYSLMDITLDYLLREWTDGETVIIGQPDPEWSGVEGRWEPA